MDPIQHADSPSVVEPEPKKATKPKTAKPKKETAAEKKARHARRPVSFLIKRARRKLKKYRAQGRPGSVVRKAAAELSKLLQKR